MAHQRRQDEVRQLVLEYFYNRNKNATSARSDKSGAAAKISIIRKDLKTLHGLHAKDVWSNLNYLIDQGWVREDQVHKSVPLRSGTIIPQITTYYKISASGIDKIEGPGVFTMNKFNGVKIEASGRNIITIGDGNQVNASFSAVGEALAKFKDAIRNSSATDALKVDVISDVDSIQSQLAKAEPNKSVIEQIWSGVQKTATVCGLAASAARVGELLKSLI